MLWEIMEDAEAHVLTVYRANGFAADSEGPTIESPEQLEEFIGDLRVAATHVWPPEAFLP
jgi:hypothetical protein